MGAVFEQMVHQPTGGGTNRLRPVEKSPRCPLQMVLVGFGHMLSQRRMAPFACTAPVRRDAFAFVEDFDRGGREAHVHGLAYEAMGNTIEVALHFEVIIEMDPRVPPLGILVGRGGEWLEDRSLIRQELSVA